MGFREKQSKLEGIGKNTVTQVRFPYRSQTYASTMTTIDIQIQDDLIQQMGVKAVKQLLEEELVYQRFKLLENRIQSAMHEAVDVNWSQEFEEARQQAFEEYQQKRKLAQ